MSFDAEDAAGDGFEGSLVNSCPFAEDVADIVGESGQDFAVSGVERDIGLKSKKVFVGKETGQRMTLRVNASHSEVVLV
jgi:hypothetical protein